jgi:hypothetical protein
MAGANGVLKMQMILYRAGLGLMAAALLAGAAAAQATAGGPSPDVLPAQAKPAGATPAQEAAGNAAADAASQALIQNLRQNDAGGMQTVAVFEKACLDHIGDAAGLRELAGSEKLPLAPPQFAAQMLRGQPGQVFNVSTPAAKRALVSFDNGMCAVNSFGGDTQAIELLILDDLERAGAVTETSKSGKSADGIALIHMYQFGLQGQHPIVTFVDLVPAGQNIAAAHELDISGGNLALKF